MNYCFSKEAGIILPFSIFILLLISACSYTPAFWPADIDTEVTITDSRRTIEFTPSSGDMSKTGRLFYPGGLVDSHVYDELLAGFTSASGIKSVVVKMPADLAVFGKDSGLRTIGDFPEITEWVIPGHSLDGAMAVSTVKKHPSVYKGLTLMDPYPPDGDSLKELPGAVLSLYSSVEKISNPEQMQKTLDLLPEMILSRPAPWFLFAADLGAEQCWNLSPGFERSLSAGPRYSISPGYSTAVTPSEILDTRLGIAAAFGL